MAGGSVDPAQETLYPRLVLGGGVQVTRPRCIAMSVCGCRRRRRPGHPKPRAWLRTVAYRHAVKARLKQRKEIEAATLLAQLGELAIHHGRPADAELSAEIAKVLRGMATLPEPQGRAIALEASGHTHAEIADRLGISTGRVSNAIREGRKTLRQQCRS